MSKNNIENLVDNLDTERTTEIFDSMIHRSKINDRSAPLDEGAIKQARAVIGAGNLHVNTSRAKMSALKMVGYIDGMAQTKKAVERKLRNSRKYSGREDE